MRNLKILIAILGCSVTFGQYAMGEIDINEVMIEADAIGIDSEASIIEAEELKAQLAEERREAEALKARLAKEKELAVIQRRKANQRIAKNEAQIAAAQKQIATYNSELKAIDLEKQKLREKVEKLQAKLNLVESDRDQVAATKQARQTELNKATRDLRDMRAKTKSTAIQVSQIRKEVKQAKVKIARVYRDTNRDRNSYKKMIETYRKSLRSASKMLDELELSIEVDHSYDNKLAAMGKTLPKNHRTVSGLNQNRLAKITSASCNVRSLPSTRGDVVGTFSGGSQVSMKYHSRSWYTVIYSGEKAFLGKSCFN